MLVDLELLLRSFSDFPRHTGRGFQIQFLTEALLRHRTFDLGAYLPPSVASAITSRMDFVRTDPYYQLVRVNGFITYEYPLGGSIMAVPFVAAFNLCGLFVTRNQQFILGEEIAIQKVMAAFLMATLTCIFFRTARLLLPPRWSAVVALGAALGSPVWSTLSRALWGQTWAVFLTGYLVYRLLEDDTKMRPVNGATLATIASWIFFARPAGAIVVGGVTVYLAMGRRDLLMQWFAAGMFWLACFVALSWKVYGLPIPPYYQGETLRSGPLPWAMAAILFSPSRGLFVFVPVSVWVIWLIVRNFGLPRHRALVLLALGICLVHLPLVASDVKWWGGCSDGPRLMSDLSPWLVLLAIIACSEELVRRRSSGPANAGVASMSPAITALGAMALGISIFMNGVGALSYATVRWNISPADLDQHPQRVWDWKRPQFLAWAFSDLGRQPPRD